MFTVSETLAEWTALMDAKIKNIVVHTKNPYHTDLMPWDIETMSGQTV